MSEKRTLRRWLLAGLLLLLLLSLAACASPLAGAGVAALATPAATPDTAPAGEAANEATKSQSETESTRYLTIYTDDDGSSQLLALDMNADGSFTLTSEPHTDAPTVVESGTWAEAGEGLITATLTRHDGRAYFRPLIVTLQRQGERLTVIASAKELTNAVGLEFVPAAAVSERARTALFTIDLAAGFPLDPTFLSVNGGGQVDASILGDGCSGYINISPVVTLNWTGEAEQVRAFFVSDSDSTLVVATPDGKILCSDDAAEQLLDPLLSLENPAPGAYRIWVGSYAKSQLLPGVLVLSARADVGPGSFALASFIKRPPLAEETLQPVRKAITETILSQAAVARLKAPALAAGKPPKRQKLTAKGETPAFEVDLGRAICNGYVAMAPDFTFEWSGESETLRIWFEGAGDATLLVLTPDQTPLCSDDAQPGSNINPLVEISQPGAGQYSVFVGRVHLDQPVAGELVITDDAGSQPAVQIPPAPVQP